VNAPRRQTYTDPDRLPHEWANHAALTLPRSTTPPTTLASGARCHAATPTGMLRAAEHPNQPQESHCDRCVSGRESPTQVAAIGPGR